MGEKWRSPREPVKKWKEGECSTWGFNKELKTEVCNRNLSQVPAERPSGVTCLEEFLVLAFLWSWACFGTVGEQSRYLDTECAWHGAAEAGMLILRARGCLDLFVQQCTDLRAHHVKENCGVIHGPHCLMSKTWKGFFSLPERGEGEVAHSECWSL